MRRMILPWLGGLIGSSLALSAFAAVPVAHPAAGKASGLATARTFDRYLVGQPFITTVPTPEPIVLPSGEPTASPSVQAPASPSVAVEEPA